MSTQVLATVFKRAFPNLSDNDKLFWANLAWFYKAAIVDYVGLYSSSSVY